MTDPRPTYTQDDRETAIRAYIVHGSYEAAEQVTGVPVGTMAVWKHRDPEWWHETYNRVSLELLRSCSTDDKEALRRIRSKVVAHLERRLESGDQKLNVKTGELVRVEIPAKELSSILSAVSSVIDAEDVVPPDEEKLRQERWAKFRQIAEDDRSKSN
jgi:hypothetical protein